MSPVVYLASPIDQGTTEEPKTRARGHLLSAGCAVFDPSVGWTVPQNATPSRNLQMGNIALLRRCDGLLAILQPDLLTIGVVLEIQEALEYGIPIAVYSKGLKASWSLAYLGVKPHSDMKEAIDELMEAMDV